MNGVTVEKVERGLVRLAEMRDQLEMIQLAYTAAMDQATAPVAKAVTAVKSKYEPEIAAVAKRMEELKGKIKEATIELGKTVDGEGVSSVYSRGRTGWDTAQLEFIAKSTPEVEEARKEGDPYASIKWK